MLSWVIWDLFRKEKQKFYVEMDVSFKKEKKNYFSFILLIKRIKAL